MEIEKLEKLSLDKGEVLIITVDTLSVSVVPSEFSESIAKFFDEIGFKNHYIIVPKGVELSVLSSDDLLKVGLKRISPLEALAEEAE